VAIDRRRAAPSDELIRQYPYLVDYEEAERFSLPFELATQWVVISVANRTVPQAMFLQLRNSVGLGPFR
jgi:hypothetical protein